MAKIFPFDPIEAASRAEAARRQAAREAAIAAEAERRRQEGERAALREREMHVWFEREAADEAAQERTARIQAAQERPAPEIVVPPASFPNLRHKVSITVRCGEHTFETSETLGALKELADRFRQIHERLLRADPEPDQPDLPSLARVGVEGMVRGEHLNRNRRFARQALAWLLLRDPAVSTPDLRAELGTAAQIELDLIVDDDCECVCHVRTGTPAA